MAGNARLDRVYADLMKRHPYGWALYKKNTAQDIRPGTLGYFDGDGDWQTIIHLADRDKVDSSPWWNQVQPKIKIKETDHKWDAKTSTGVRQRRVGGTLGASTVVAPVSASATLEFSNERNDAAVLVTSSLVKFAQIQMEDSQECTSLLAWLQQPGTYKTIIARYGSAFEKHGLWLVSKTYSCERAGIALLSSGSRSIEIGLGVDAQGVVTLTPSSKWSQNGQGASCEVHEDPDGVVVFMSGIYVTKSKRLWSKVNAEEEQEKQDMLRGGEDDDFVSDIEVEDEDGKEVKLDVEYFPPRRPD